MGLLEFLFPSNSSSNRTSINRIKDSQKWKSLKNDYRAIRLEERIDDLEKDLMTLTLSFASLLDSINEKGVVTREEIREKIGQLDGLDGLNDGKLPISLIRNWTDDSGNS